MAASTRYTRAPTDTQASADIGGARSAATEEEAAVRQSIRSAAAMEGNSPRASFRKAAEVVSTAAGASKAMRPKSKQGR